MTNAVITADKPRDVRELLGCVEFITSAMFRERESAWKLGILRNDREKRWGALIPIFSLDV